MTRKEHSNSLSNINMGYVIYFLFQIKIKDFVFSGCGVVYKDKTKGLPFGHYPPEARLQRRLEQLGDVWCFGILFWELMTDAKKPFDLDKAQEIDVMLNHGISFELPSMPSNTPKDMKTIFTDNVLTKEDKRKTMTDVNLMLEKALDIQPILANKLFRKNKDFQNKTTTTCEKVTDK